MLFPKWKIVFSQSFSQQMVSKKHAGVEWAEILVYELQENRKGGRRGFEIDDWHKKRIPHEYIFARFAHHGIDINITPYKDGELVK